MKVWEFILAMLISSIVVFAEPSPKVVYNAYIDYPSRHDYRIEIFTFPSGLISRIATYSGEPLAKTEEMMITEKQGNAFGEDKFQKSVKSISLVRRGDSIAFTKTLANTDNRSKTTERKTIRLRSKAGVIFEDGIVRCLLADTGELRIEPLRGKDDPIVIRENSIYQDGWYRSDWKKEAGNIVIHDYTTMEIPGDWIDNGGGVFVAHDLFSDDPAINVMNYSIIGAYMDARTFLPLLFGLKTGSY